MSSVRDDEVVLVYEAIKDIVTKWVASPMANGQIEVGYIKLKLDARGIDTNGALEVYNDRHESNGSVIDMVKALYLQWFCEDYQYGEWLTDNGYYYADDGSKDVVVSVGKYELWNALYLTDKSAKTDGIIELADKIDNLMSKPGRVVITIRVEE